MKAIYLGDSQTKEFHSIKRQKPECNVKLITAKREVRFSRGKDAIAAGYDACAHCSRYWKSRH
jgi:hypothetical protein